MVRSALAHDRHHLPTAAQAEFGTSEVKEEAWKEEDRDGPFARLLTMRSASCRNATDAILSSLPYPV